MPDSPATTEPSDLRPTFAASEAGTTGTTEGRPTRRRRIRIRLIYVAVLFTAYILSIGPMFWAWHYAEHFGGNEFIRVFYVPLRLLCEFEPFESLINQYIRWWIL